MDLNVLSALMLKLDNEKMIYEESNVILYDKMTDIKEKYKFGIEIHNFLNSIRNFTKEEVVEKYESFVDEMVDDKRIGDYFKLDKDSIHENGLTYSIATEGDPEYFLPENAGCKFYQMYEALSSNGKKTITTIVQYFEEYLAFLLRAIISDKPDAFLYDKQIKYNQLINSDIEKLKEDIVNQTVKELMYDVTKTIKKISEVYNFDISKNDVFDKYVEINAHRNIIVHNSGFVNSDYNGLVSKKYQKELGTNICCNQDLIDEDIFSVKKFAFLLFFMIGNSESELEILESVAFTSLCHEEWEFCEYAYGLLSKNKSSSHEAKLLYRINQLLAKKNIRGLESVKKEIDDLDVSGMLDYYTIGKDLLLENNSKIVEKLEANFNDCYNAYNIIKWPIFIEFRKTDEYNEFVKKHSKEFKEFTGKSTDECPNYEICD